MMGEASSHVPVLIVLMVVVVAGGLSWARPGEEETSGPLLGEDLR